MSWVRVPPEAAHLLIVVLCCVVLPKYRLDVESRDLRDFKAEGPGL